MVFVVLLQALIALIELKGKKKLKEELKTLNEDMDDVFDKLFPV